MKTILKRDPDCELESADLTGYSVHEEIGGREIYLGRVSSDRRGEWRAMARGGFVLKAAGANPFGTRGEAIAAIKEFWRPDSPVRLRMSNPTHLSTNGAVGTQAAPERRRNNTRRRKPANQNRTQTCLNLGRAGERAR